MGWLVGYTIASMVGALFVVRIFDYIFGGIVGGIAHAARPGLFVGVWTAITAGLGMRDFTTRVQKLRKSNREVSNKLDALPKKKGGRGK